MKILYAIQGTGNGHLSRARDIVPVLMKNHDVEILVSGSQSDVDFPYPVKYQLKGLGLYFWLEWRHRYTGNIQEELYQGTIVGDKQFAGQRLRSGNQ